LATCGWLSGQHALANELPVAQTPPPAAPQRVIVPLGASEDLPAPVTSIQMMGELPPGIPVDEISDLLTEPRSITKLSELKALAQRIEQLVQSKGYPFFYVSLPDQEIFNGRVRLLVVNGKISRVVRIQGDSRRLTDERAHDYFTQLIDSGGFKRVDFERTMLLLNELPAMQARLVLNPGAAPGLIDAVLHLDEGPLARWSFNLNNHGAESTGRERLTVNLKLNDLSGRGDRLSLTVSKTSRNLSANVVEYRTPIGISGLSAQLTLLQSGFGVDAGLNSLGVKGSTRSTEFSVSYPLWLRFGQRLYADGSTTRRHTSNDIEMLDPMRKLMQVNRIGLRGSVDDKWGGGGSTSARLSYFDGSSSPLAGYSDLSRRRFSEQTFEVSRNQSLGGKTTLMLSWAGQRTGHALDGSEQMGFGGPGAVRAYSSGTLFADQGNLYKTELAQVLEPDLRGAGTLRGFAFYDRGVAFADAVTGGRNTITGAGVGLSITRWGHYEVRATYARRIGTSAFGNLPEDQSRSGQFWLNAVAFF
jgi:hemolysin activation/secretion protein